MATTKYDLPRLFDAIRQILAKETQVKLTYEFNTDGEFLFDPEIQDYGDEYGYPLHIALMRVCNNYCFNSPSADTFNDSDMPQELNPQGEITLTLNLASLWAADKSQNRYMYKALNEAIFTKARCIPARFFLTDSDCDYMTEKAHKLAENNPEQPAFLLDYSFHVSLKEYD